MVTSSPRRTVGVVVLLALVAAVLFGIPLDARAADAAAGGPTVTVASPTDGQMVEIASSLVADFECGGDGISCTATLDGGEAVDDGDALPTADLGARTLTVIATDDDTGETATAAATYTVIDTTDPAATIVSPADGSEVPLGADLTVDFTCSDDGGAGIDTCVGDIADGEPVDTSTPGLHSFTLTATDAAGNDTTTTVHFLVTEADADGDGILDSSDGCPEEEGLAPNGCPAERRIVSPDSPLDDIQITRDLNCGVFKAGSEFFYGNVACGTFLLVGTTVYGPADVPAGPSPTPWTPVAQSQVTGTGAADDPFTVVTEVAAGETGIRLVQTDRYVAGASTTSTSIEVENTTDATTEVRLWRAADCYFQGSDYGYGTFVTATQAVGCREGVTRASGAQVPGTLVLEWAPVTGDSSYYEEYYDSIWDRISSQLAFPDSCICERYIDNGAGLSWDVSVGAGSTVVLGHDLNVVERAVQQGEMPGDADVDGVADASDNCVGVFNPEQGNSDGDAVGDTCEVPVPPTNLRSTDATATSNTMAWDHGGADTTRYIVAYGLAFSNSYTQVEVGTSPLSFARTGIAPGTSWTYFVRACNGPYCSDWSDAVTVDLAVAALPDAPTGLAVTRETNSSIKVAWDDNSDNETSFQIAYVVDGQDDWAFANIGENNEHYTLSGRTQGSRWTFIVRACNEAGCSAWSNFDTGTASAASVDLSLSMAGPTIGVGGSEYEYKLIVRNLSTTTAARDVTVTSPLLDNVSYAGVHSSEGRGCSGNLADRLATCTVSSIAPSSTYTMWVQVVPNATDAMTFTGSVATVGTNDPTSSNNGASLAINDLGTPSAPTLRHVSSSAGTNVVAWDNTSGNATSYTVWWSEYGSLTWNHAELGFANEATHSGVATNSRWTYLVKACLDTRCSPWSNALTLTAGPTATVTAIEVNQVVQDWENSVPLVEDKTTVVRVFSQISDGAAIPVGARLHGTRNGVTLPGSPLSPINAGGTASIGTALPNRGSLDSSLNFQLPDSWLSGTVELRAELSGVNAACGEAAGPTEDDCKATVSFRATSTPSIRFSKVAWRNGGTTFAPTNAQIAELAMRVRSNLPAAQVSYSSADFGVTYTSEPSLATDINARLLTARTAAGCGDGCDTVYYGVLAGQSAGSIAGLANGVPGRVASSFLSTFVGAWRNVHVHEIAHVFGRPHAVQATDNGTTATGLPRGYCGEAADVGTPDHPYIATIGGRKRPVLGPMSSEDEKVYGVDTRFVASGSPLAVIDPSSTFAMMSYCDNLAADSQGVWPSKNEYEALLDGDFDVDGTAIAGAAAAKIAVAPSVPTQQILVRGAIESDLASATLAPVTMSTDVAEPAADGAYRVVLRDAGGDPLAEVPFDVTEAHPRLAPGSTGELAEALMFAVPVTLPDEPVYEIAVTTDDGDELGSVIATANAPTVDITSPSSGDQLIGDTVDIAWTAADADDAAELSASIFYSADGGSTWQTMAVDVTDANVEIDRDSLPASTTAMLRVVVSDGVNVASDEVGPFSVANAEPDVTVDQPVDGQSVSPEQSVVLAAAANDLEDGALTGESLRWSSDLDGDLGTGTNLTVPGTALTVGEHVITVTAKDSVGALATKQLRVSVAPSVVPQLGGDGDDGDDGGVDGTPPIIGGFTPDPDGGDGEMPAGSVELAGDDRIGTSVEISRATFRDASDKALASVPATAESAVIASAMSFADALVGAPLAADRVGPMLLTDPAELSDAVLDELHRILPAGATVHVLGGTGAVSTAVEDALRAEGFDVERVAGADRFETSVAVARALGSPDAVLYATGLDFPDALAAGAAAAHLRGAVLLTDGEHLDDTVAAFAASLDVPAYAVGGSAVRAVPDAAPIGGADRYATAVAVADALFDEPAVVGVASGERFADALSGGAHAALLDAPLLLVRRTVLEPADYLEANRASITTAFVYGGPAAIGDTVRRDLAEAID